MSRGRWHISREESALTLARRLPPRFDICVVLDLPQGAKLRLAHQIRQDMWRSLRNLRGFSPVVRIEDVGTHLKVLAGGRVDGTFTKTQCEQRLRETLDCPKRQERWLRCVT